MNPVETHEITELIGKLRDEGGYTILVIEHDMHVVEGISDRVVALDHGVKIAEGTFEQVATDPRVVEAYLGHERDGDEVSEARTALEPLLELDARRHLLRPDPHPPGRVARGRAGELVCLLGGNASGKSTTLKTDPRDRASRGAATVTFAGEDVTAARRATGSARASPSCPRTGGSSGR